MKNWVDMLEIHNQKTIKYIFKDDEIIPDLKKIYISKIITYEYSMIIFFYFPLPKNVANNVIKRGKNITLGQFNLSEVEKLRIDKIKFSHDLLEVYDFYLEKSDEVFKLMIKSNFNTIISCEFNYFSLLNFGFSKIEEEFLIRFPSKYSS